MNNNKPFYLKNRSAVHKLTFGLPGSGISSVMEKEITTIANNTKDDNIVVIDIDGGQFIETVKKLGGVIITAKEIFACFDEIVFGSLQESDEDNFGFTYDELDEKIRKGTCGNKKIDKIIELKHHTNAFKLKKTASYMPTFMA